MNNDKRVMKDRLILKRAFPYIKKYLSDFIIAFIMLIFNVAINIILPLIISSTSTKLKQITITPNQKLLYNVIFFAVGYLLLTIINVLMQYNMSVRLQKAGQKIVVDLRNDVFDHIESLSLLQLNDIPVGKLVTRVTNDTVSLSDLFSTVFVNLLKDFLLASTTFIVMFVVNYVLALYMLIFVVLVLSISIVFKIVSKKVFRVEREKVSNINSFVSENLSGMKVTQVFNQEERIKKEFDKKNKELEKASFNVTLAFAFYRPTTNLIYFLAVSVCFLLGVPSTNSEIFLLFYLYLSHFFEPIHHFADLLNSVSKGFAAAERLFLLLDVKPLVENKKDAIVLDKFEGNIEFNHVYFAYKDEEWILKDVSFKINKGETVAFVGQTGAGKTTILSLIVRNYDIQKGHIYIDGYDIKDIDITSLRKNIGQMLQDVFLFSGNIKSNIRLRNNEITDEEINSAIEFVHADSFINKLDNKLEEVVNEQGTNFSQGEKQLLSFARTIVRKPSILILDEATANIDTESEILIQKSLAKMKSIGTMLIVAHRLSTIRNADKIIVIENGQISEQGNHEELMKNKKFYYNLVSISML